MAQLINEFAPPAALKGIDVGCQRGAIADAMTRSTRVGSWVGIDPTLSAPIVSSEGCELVPGRAASIPFPDQHFDVALFANVYEHVTPGERDASFQEMLRVLTPLGIVVGQLPNPYFPIESHSRLPFMGWLPVSVQKKYWRAAPVPWEHDFYVVTIAHLLRTAQRAGFEILQRGHFNYPPEVIPRSVRWAARGLERPMRLLPWAWRFVLRRPEHA